MIIQHNILSMFTDRNLRITTGNRAKTSERLASGYRINRAADDAAGLTISEKLRSLVRGHNRAADNVQDGISLLQVADGALNEVHNSLHRMSELAVQAANDTNTDADREKLQDEIDAIKNEINRISTDTEFNTLKIFNFEEEDGIDLEAFRGGLENYAINSRDVSTPTQAVTFPPSSITLNPINRFTQAYIPSLTSSNDISGGYGMEADETGIRMYLPAKYNPAGTGKVYFDLKTWAQLGSSGTYTYEMNINGLNLGNIAFTIDSEASRQEIIDSINNWQLDVVATNRMTFNIVTNDTSGATISHKEHSESLDAFGTHYAMGRQMNSTLQMTFPNGQGMTISGNDLSFTMADANSKQYTFTATNVRAAIENEVTAAFRTYITNYQQAYQTAYDNYLQTAAGRNNPNSFTFNGSSIASPTPSGSVTFYDNANGHSVTLSFTGRNVFRGILTQGDFALSYTGPDNSGRLTGYANPNSGLTTTYQAQINEITDKIYNSFKGINMNSITATSLSPNRGVLVDVKIGIRVPDPDVNPPTETVTPDGRKLRQLMIQAGPNTKQAIGIDLPPMNTTILKVGNVNVSTYDGASTAIGQISGAVEYISDMRSGYGATQNRLEHAFAINNISEENAQAAESRIRDTDMAEELVIYSKNNILIQAAESMLAQNNQSTEMVLTLLQ